MAITYGFFNSLNGDRLYDADQMSEYFDGLVSDGVYESVGGACQVFAGLGMGVIVATGRAILDSKWVKLDAAEPLTITSSHVTLNRYTAVVLRLDYANRQIVLTTKDGTPASTPSQPTAQRDSTYYELILAMIYVPAGATAIAQSNITDMRSSSSCGWVTGVVEQLDTSELFIQWQDAYQTYYDSMTAGFEEWFSTLTEELNVNTYIKEYTKKFTIASGMSYVLFTASNYTYDSDDIIHVFINGLKALPGEDFTAEAITSLGEQTLKITLLNNPSNQMVGAEVFVEVTKSKIGYPI